jgi:kynureninase
MKNTIMLPYRFAGWWGHNKERFKMEPQFDPVKGAEGWQISNLPILSLAPYLASVDMFDEIGMDAIIENKITAYLEFVLQEIDKEVDSTLKLLLQLILPKEVASCLSFTWGRS